MDAARRHPRRSGERGHVCGGCGARADGASGELEDAVPPAVGERREEAHGVRMLLAVDEQCKFRSFDWRYLT